jgi:iron complex outermembrane receptor protein
VKNIHLNRLKAGVAPLVLGVALWSSPAFAQVDCDANPNASECADDEGDTIVVTGSLFRRTDTETASPVTSLSAETLEERGINTAAEAVQRIPSNNAGTIQQGWNTGFNFASGANAPALRGLTVQSTLSIADGLRIAPYPLADDGQRNFVDLNTIPNAIIDRIEILRDGASSTYGADAIAGVINVITKKEIQGLHAEASYGISEGGDAEEILANATWGYGDLAEDGFNFYVSGEWSHQDPLWARDTDYPFNSTDWSGVCGPTGSCMANLNWNGWTPESGFFNGLVSTPGVSLVRRGSLVNPATGTGRFEFLDPANGCREFPLQPNIGASGTAPLQGACEIDLNNKYIMFQPEIERRGLSGRVTFNVGEKHQVYAMVNWYNTLTDASFTPLGLNGTPTPPNNGAAAYNVMLPVYVCAAGVGTLNGLNTGCNAGNGTLNPMNPYAGEGRTAQLFLRHTRGREVDTDSRVLRGVIGAEGEIGTGWFYTATFTASESKLRRDEGNYFIPQRIADLAARGEIDFVNWDSNPESVFDQIAPLESTVSTADLWQVQATLAREVFELPGGPLQVAVGGLYREESINAPSANPGTTGNQYERYYSINSVGTAGSRDVKSAFFEIDAPVIDNLEFNISGRYDKYSTGQDAFSPKVGAKFTPIPELAIRGTWSKGFRIPSFNESFGLPTTGYVTRVVNCTDFAAFCAAHGNNAYATGQYPLGLTQVGNPDLDPEKSTAFTAGIILEPIRNVSFTVDWWRIKVNGLITGVTDTSAAEEEYYANNGVVNIPGITILPGAPDPAFPAALPLLGFIQTSYTNQNSQTVSGLDFGANATFPVNDDLRWRSNFEASWLMKYQLRSDSGDILNYEGTLSPCNITSCSGAPEWRATWQNSLDVFEDTTLSMTVYYTDGYDTASIDFGGVEGDCLFNAANHASTTTYEDGSPVNCKQGSAWNVDFNARHTIADKFTLYLDVLNIFNIGADFDPSAAYGLFGFNPAWQGPNILGRYFRLGAKVDF